MDSNFKVQNWSRSADFQSAATRELSTVSENALDLLPFNVAADWKVRAPPALRNSSQTGNTGDSLLDTYTLII